MDFKHIYKSFLVKKTLYFFKNLISLRTKIFIRKSFTY